MARGFVSVTIVLIILLSGVNFRCRAHRLQTTGNTSLDLEDFEGNNTWVPDAIPNPMTDPQRCGRPGVPTSAVCDPDDLLTVASKDRIEGHINGLRSSAQVAVLAIAQMRPDFVGWQSIETASESFARSVHDHWGVGDQTRQDGVLVFLSTKDRVAFISTGAGVERLVTRQQIDRIVEAMRPELRAADWGSALERAVVEIGSLVVGDNSSEEVHTSWFHTLLSGCADFVLQVIIRILAQFGAWLFLCALIAPFRLVQWGFNKWKARRLNQGRRAVQALMIEASDEANRYHATSCPICFEDFPAAGTGTPAQRPMALRCGHVFCWQCLSGFLQSAGGNRCPICRRPPDEDGRFVQEYHQTSEQWFEPAFFRQPNYTSSLNYRRWRAAELQFRVDRIRTQYPEVMPDHTARALQAQLQGGSLGQFREAAVVHDAEVARIVTNHEAQALQSGSRGSYFPSFGGGRSSGGGGGRF